jgi:hypothetical protein
VLLTSIDEGVVGLISGSDELDNGEVCSVVGRYLLKHETVWFGQLVVMVPSVSRL